MVDPEKRRTMGRILKKSFRLPLEGTETAALECLCQLADSGLEASQEAIRGAVAMSGAGSATAIINRLVRKGYIEHVMGHPLQRGIWVRIVDTGQLTAEPKCKIAHWRYRTDRVPSPAIQSIRQRSKSLADMIEDRAKALHLPLADFLMDCVYAGFHHIAEDEQQ